jgi:hypothetical protein
MLMYLNMYKQILPYLNKSLSIETNDSLTQQIWTYLNT